ncbi:MAG: KdsC family phosphatase [Armatimonadota bacterium]
MTDRLPDNQGLHVRAAGLRCLVCDVDGTLTDGGVAYHSDGTESRRFHIRDGLGIVAARRVGFHVVWISGRESVVVRRRAEELGVALLMQAVRDKAEALRAVSESLGIPFDAIAFIGDDLNDLPGFRRAGMALAPSDAARDVREAADLVLETAGGAGAVREALEWILRCRGEWESARDGYIDALIEPSSGRDPRPPGQ